MDTYESDVRTKYEAWCTCGWTETHAKEFQAARASVIHDEEHAILQKIATPPTTNRSLEAPP